MESGEFKKRNLPYGYRWDEEHSNMVFDEETAPIVRKIFQWKIEPGRERPGHDVADHHEPGDPAADPGDAGGRGAHF